ncbi:MAG TPA: hypothetical protein VK901_04195 [Nitrospiraceae bacterium]|nr:hypothetical protein [Nitrospiraceae bacterium]
MTCSRCRRLIIEDRSLDLESPYGQRWASSLRCANCGHGHSSVIEQHRLAPQEKALVRSSGEPDYQDEEVHLGAESFIRRVA